MKNTFISSHLHEGHFTYSLYHWFIGQVPGLKNTKQFPNEYKNFVFMFPKIAVELLKSGETVDLKSYRLEPLELGPTELKPIAQKQQCCCVILLISISGLFIFCFYFSQKCSTSQIVVVYRITQFQNKNNKQKFHMSNQLRQLKQSCHFSPMFHRQLKTHFTARRVNLSDF